MTSRWKILDTAPTPEGLLELRQRAEGEIVLSIGGRVLMNSVSQRSEQALATLGCARIGARGRVLVGGLGMGLTLRAALDVLPASAAVTVVELDPTIVGWCRGVLGPLTNGAVDDPRVTVVTGDVAKVIATADRGAYDAILLDLYEGPHAATQYRNDPFWGPEALLRTRAAIAPGGTLAVWGEDPDPAFPVRFTKAGFTVTTHRPGKGRTHVVWVGIRT